MKKDGVELTLYKQHLMKKYILFTLMIGWAMFAHAQFEKQLENRKEQIATIKIAFFTKQLSLTSKEAAVFWPVYNAYEEELETVYKDNRLLQNKMKQAMLNDSDESIEKMADAYIANERKKADIADKYHVEFKKVLPIRKVVLLYRAEQAFKSELLKRIQNQENRFQNQGMNRERMEKRRQQFRDRQ